MKFKARVYDTTNGKPLMIEVRNINVQHKVVIGQNGMRYKEFKLFYVSDYYPDGKLLYQTSNPLV